MATRVQTQAAAVAISLSLLAPLASAQPILPPPNPGSFTTSFNFDVFLNRVVAFDGFQIFRQTSSGSSNFTSIGSLPAEFEGGTDPAFALTSLFGGFYLLGAGAGGSQFPATSFNGNLFLLPFSGGEASLVANIPFHTGATFRLPFEVFVSAGVSTFDSFHVERLNLLTNNLATVIDNGPGASAGVGVDIAGNLYTGIGFDAAGARTGEIRKFSQNSVTQALLTGVPIAFDEGLFVSQTLSATGILFDAQGDMWVAGGDFFGGSGALGFVAEIDPETGAILRQINPTGNPDAFFSIAIDHQFGCEIGISEGTEVFLVNACE